MRAWLVAAAIVAIPAVGCAMPSPDSARRDDSSFSTQVATSVTTSTTALASSSTTTWEAPIATTATGLPSTTTTETEFSPVLDDPESWVGVEFEAATSHPFVEPVSILANIDYVSLAIDGDPASAYPWFVAMTANAFTGPTYYGLVVGDTPHPYRITEIEQEDGVPFPRRPKPGTTHRIHIWAIRTLTDSTYLITDAFATELDADLLYAQTSEFRSILNYAYSCDLDTSVRQAVPFAFFAYSDELEIDKKYPADYAFVFDNEEVEAVPGEYVSCVVRFNPENY